MFIYAYTRLPLRPKPIGSNISASAFVYHCFDRIVIYGYLSGLSRPERAVNFFHLVIGVPVVSKEILRQRSADYHNLGRSLRAQSSDPRSNGPKRPCARKTMSCRGNAAW